MDESGSVTKRFYNPKKKKELRDANLSRKQNNINILPLYILRIVLLIH